MRTILFAVMILLPFWMLGDNVAVDSVRVWTRLIDGVNSLPVGGAKISVLSHSDAVLVDSLPCALLDPSDQHPFGSALYYSDSGILLDSIKGLHIARAGYEPLDVPVTAAEQRGWRLTFNYIKINREAKRLNEITVMATKVKMVMKGDTLVYDASAFQMADGSMLDDLIRALPGASLDRNGVIKVNGNVVSSLLVNGREFFKGDPWIALKNLPYYTVKNIKVYNRPRERDAEAKNRTSEDRLNDPLVMDVNLKPEYIGGWLANAEAGAGSTTNHHAELKWMGRIFGMHYNKTSTFAVYAQANNLNDGQTVGYKGQWSRPSMSAGLETHKLAGLQYNVDWTDQPRNGIEFRADVHRSTSDSRFESIIEQFLVGGNNLSRTQGRMDDKDLSVYSSLKVTRRFKPAKVGFDGKYSYAHHRRAEEETSEQSQGSETYDLLYRRLQTGFGKSGEHDFGLNLDIFPDIAEISWLDDLWVGGQFGYSQYNSTGSDTDVLTYIATPESNRNTEYADLTRRYGHNYGISAKVATCRFKAGKSEWKFSFDYAYRQKFDYNSFIRDFRDLEQQIDQSLPSVRWELDTQNSFRTSTHERENKFHPHLSYQHRTLFVTLGTDISLLSRGILDRRYANNLSANKTDAIYAPRLELSAGPSDKRFNLTLSLTQRLPSITQFIPTTNTSNSLHIRKTNPNLRHADIYSVSADVSLKDVGFSIGYSRTDNALSIARTYNRETGVYTSMPRNINGNWDTDANISYSKNFGPVYLMNSLYGRWNHTVDFSSDGDTPFRMATNNQNIVDNLKINFDYKNWQVIGNANIKWNRLESTYGNSFLMRYWDMSYGLSLLTPRLLGISIETDLMLYCRRGYNDASMNTTDWVWNISASRSFGRHKQWTAKIMAYDLLQQFPNVRRVLNSMGNYETRYNTLPSYALLTLTYRLDIKPKKK